MDENQTNLESIFSRVNELFYNVFTTDNGNKNDGMALSILSYDNENIHLLGAQQSFLIFDKNNFSEIKFQSTPINFNPQKSNFAQQIFKTKSIERIVLFTDGVIDQKGGLDNNRLKKEGFKEWVINNDFKTNYYENKLSSWMQIYNEQIDDILILDIFFKKNN